MISKFRTLVSGLHASIAGLSADSKRLAEVIAVNQGLAKSKREYLGTTQVRLRASEQKLEKLTGRMDNTK